jgi:hypothetical protein
VRYDSGAALDGVESALRAQQNDLVALLDAVLGENSLPEEERTQVAELSDPEESDDQRYQVISEHRCLALMGSSAVFHTSITHDSHLLWLTLSDSHSHARSYKHTHTHTLRSPYPRIV